jgi:hypothetical protein
MTRNFWIRWGTINFLGRCELNEGSYYLVTWAWDVGKERHLSRSLQVMFSSHLRAFVNWQAGEPIFPSPYLVLTLIVTCSMHVMSARSILFFVPYLYWKVARDFKHSLIKQDQGRCQTKLMFDQKSTMCIWQINTKVRLSKIGHNTHHLPLLSV